VSNSFQDEDLDLVCCDDCGRWQHTECHDRMDRAQRRPPRNWSKVDFKVGTKIGELRQVLTSYSVRIVCIGTLENVKESSSTDLPRMVAPTD
jgi:alpha-L-arabinofuranosidase